MIMMLKEYVLLNTILFSCQAFIYKFTKYLYLRNDSHFEIEFEIEIIMILIRRLIHKTTLEHE